MEVTGLCAVDWRSHAQQLPPVLGCRFPLLVISPEGTCKHSNCLLQFSTGAFVGGRPVLPILLRYRARSVPSCILSVKYILKTVK